MSNLRACGPGLGMHAFPDLDMMNQEKYFGFFIPSFVKGVGYNLRPPINTAETIKKYLKAHPRFPNGVEISNEHLQAIHKIAPSFNGFNLWGLNGEYSITFMDFDLEFDKGVEWLAIFDGELLDEKGDSYIAVFEDGSFKTGHVDDDCV